MAKFLLAWVVATLARMLVDGRRVHEEVVSLFGTGMCRRVLDPAAYEELTVQNWHPIARGTGGGMLLNLGYPTSGASLFALVFNVWRGRAVVTLERVCGSERGREMYVFSACAPWPRPSRYHNARAYFLGDYVEKTKDFVVLRTVEWASAEVGIFDERVLNVLCRKLPFRRISAVAPTVAWQKRPGEVAVGSHQRSLGIFGSHKALRACARERVDRGRDGVARVTYVD